MVKELAIDLPVEASVNAKRICYDWSFHGGSDISLVCGDVLDVLSAVPDRSCSLVFTSPPYNLGKAYETSQDFEDYVNWQGEVIGECVRVLDGEGSLCWQVGNYVEDGEIYPLDIHLYDKFKERDLKLRNRIVWHFGHGLHAKRRLSGRYETILWFSKGDNYAFNLDDVRVPQKYPGKRAYKGPNKGEPTGNPNGKNPSDVWSVVEREWDRGIWRIPNLKANHPERTIHPSQFPIELAERVVLALTDEGDVILDPFVGVGTTLIAASIHGRRAVGIDKEKLYTDVAFRRTKLGLQGKLSRRPLGKEIYVPKGSEKVAKPPPEWSESTDE